MALALVLADEGHPEYAKEAIVALLSEPAPLSIEQISGLQAIQLMSDVMAGRHGTLNSAHFLEALRKELSRYFEKDALTRTIPSPIERVRERDRLSRFLARHA